MLLPPAIYDPRAIEHLLVVYKPGLYFCTTLEGTPGYLSVDNLTHYREWYPAGDWQNLDRIREIAVELHEFWMGSSANWNISRIIELQEEAKKLAEPVAEI